VVEPVLDAIQGVTDSVLRLFSIMAATTTAAADTAYPQIEACMQRESVCV
jgi:hypothetical protein